MSRIGKQPISLPEAVEARQADGRLQVKGPKGQLELELPAGVSVVIDEPGRQVRVERGSDARRDRALHGLFRSLIANMVVGVTEGYEKRMQLVGVGYSAQVQGRKLALQIGFSHPVIVDIPDGVEIQPPQTGSMLISGVGQVPIVNMVIQGIDKQKVGNFAAQVRSLRKPDPYKAKGIRYADEEIRRKVGKAFAAGE